MTHESLSARPKLDARARAAWQSQLAIAAKQPGMLPDLMRRREEILPRFGSYYDRLRRLPRRLRRALQRRWVSLAALALALALGGTPSAAATIPVGGGCTLADAIVAANTDVATGGCTAGSGADTIALPSGSMQTFSLSGDQTYGATALPVIRSTITIAGNGSTIQRDPAGVSLRLMAIASTGDLTLQDTTLSGGKFAENDGGAIYVSRGKLTLLNSTVSGNSADNGGGIMSNRGTVTLTGSTIANNSVRSIDLADGDCSALALSSEKGTLSLEPDPGTDQVSLTAAFPSGASFNPRLEGAAVSVFDAAGQIACVRIPSEAAAAGAWKEKTSGKGTSWSFKDAKDGSVGDPTRDTFSAQCSTTKSTCTVKLNVKLANLAGDGTARSITTGVAIGDDAWTRQQPWQSKSKGTKLSTP